MVCDLTIETQPTAEQGLPHNHFKMIDTVGLKLLHQGPLEWHHIPNKFHEALPIGTKVISEGHTQTGTDRISINNKTVS
jgi:hypothetical protein